MITAIIIDDEPHCISNLERLLAEYSSNTVELKGCYETLKEGMQAIKQIQPGLVFLDVKVKGQSAFELLEQLPHINFEIIFTTGHDEYAAQAFRFSAIDYLLKPVNAYELVTAIEKIKNKFSQSDVTEKFNVLFHNIKTIETTSKKICLPVLTGFVFVKVDDIIRCESSLNYTTIFTIDTKKLLVSKTLKEIEGLLKDCNFFRVHHSHLINLNRIKNYNKGRGGSVVMEDGSVVDVSTRKKEDFLKRIAAL